MYISIAQVYTIWVYRAGASIAIALSLWCRAHLRTWWSFLVAGVGETSCFGGRLFVTGTRDRNCFSSTRCFRGRCILFGHGGDCQGAQIS